MKELSNGVLVIPSLNPDEKLIELLQKASAYFLDIIVVNDGSEEDIIFEKIKKTFSQVHLLKHKTNKGKGVALKTAMRYFLSSSLFSSYTGIITADADGQHEIADIISLDKQLGKNRKKSFIIGYRDLNSKVMPIRSKMGNKITAFLFSLLYGIKLKDTQSGLRAFSKDILPWVLSVSGARFEYEMNMLIKIKNTKYQIIEIPITTKYETNHKSHFRSFVDSIRVLKVLLSGIIKFIIAGLIAGLADIGLFAFLSSIILVDKSSLAINLLISSVVARIFSSIINFVFNRFITFGGTKISKKSILKYYILWIIQLALSYAIVLLLTSLLGGGKIIIKLIVDLVLALLSYQVQLKWVFTKKGSN